MDIIFADNFDSYLGSNEEVVNAGVKEVFRGTEEEVLEWLRVNYTWNPDADHFWVKVGDSEKAIHVSSYLDPKQRDENRDSRLKKQQAIIGYIREAIESPEPNAEAYLSAAKKIQKLYT